MSWPVPACARRALRAPAADFGDPVVVASVLRISDCSSGSIDFVSVRCGPLIMHENQQPQTEAFELSAAEREAIEHEKHHYEDPRQSIEALKIVHRSSAAGAGRRDPRYCRCAGTLRRATSKRRHILP